MDAKKCMKRAKDFALEQFVPPWWRKMTSCVVVCVLFLKVGLRQKRRFEGKEALTWDYQKCISSTVQVMFIYWCEQIKNKNLSISCLTRLVSAFLGS